MVGHYNVRRCSYSNNSDTNVQPHMGELRLMKNSITGVFPEEFERELIPQLPMFKLNFFDKWILRRVLKKYRRVLNGISKEAHWRDLSYYLCINIRHLFSGSGRYIAYYLLRKIARSLRNLGGCLVTTNLTGGCKIRVFTYLNGRYYLRVLWIEELLRYNERQV